MKKKKIKLDAYERDIEKNLHKFKPVKNQKTELAKLKLAAKNYAAQRKPVTIRLQQSDIDSIRLKAEKIGVPYQTYLNIIIHREAINP